MGDKSRPVVSWDQALSDIRAAKPELVAPFEAARKRGRALEAVKIWKQAMQAAPAKKSGA